MERPLRIALAVNRFAPSTGGIETHVDRLSRSLTESGHHVTVLTHDHWGDLPERDCIDGVEIRRFPLVMKSRHLAVSFALGRHLAHNADAYDLVHAHGYHDSPAMMAAAFWKGPLVFTPHFHGSSESAFRNLLHRPYRLIGRRIVSRSDRIIGVSGAEAESLVATFPHAAAKTEVISNGVDVKRLQSAPRSPTADGRRILLAAGRLDHYKQVDRIVAAMPYLCDDFVLEITGDGPAHDDLANLIHSQGLEGDVHLLGRVPDDTLASLFRTASCLVSMSTHEAQGIVLLEALAAGTRVLASSIPAHVDVGRQAGGAVAITPVESHPRSLAGAIRDACSKPRPDVFVPSWSEVALQTSMLYERMLAEGGSDRAAIDSAAGFTEMTRPIV